MLPQMLQLHTFIPLVSLTLGIIIALLILVSGRKSPAPVKAKVVLLALIAMLIHYQAEYVLVNISDGSLVLNFGILSYANYHLLGCLIYLYGVILLRKTQAIKPQWYAIWAIFSIVRFTFVVYCDTQMRGIGTIADIQYDDPVLVYIGIDYLIANAINITMLYKSYKLIQGIDFSVELSRTEQININWYKRIHILSIVFFCGMIISNITSSVFIEKWRFFYNFESALIGFFFFATIFFASRFPVFSVYGNFTDLNTEDKIKYKNSALSKVDTTKTWQRVVAYFENEKPYLDPEYRLNDLAHALDLPLHHLSQIINEHGKVSFSELVNRYRVEEVKCLLNDPEKKDYTILAIAYEVGFNSKASFYNAFKKITGVTPSVYKKGS